MPPDVTPAGYLCPACGYAAGGLRGRICPECAAPVTDATLVAWRARAELTSSWRGLVGGQLSAAAAVAIGYSGVAWLLLGEPEVALIALVACGVIYGGSAAAGLLCVALMAPEERRAAAALWLRELWLVNLPWIILGPGALIALVIPTEAILALPLWALIVAPLPWASRMSRAAERSMLRPGYAAVLFAGVGIATLLASTAIGLAGGSAAVMGALELIGGVSLSD